MTYEQQFDAGERQAFQDRKRCARKPYPVGPLTDDERAWWDGYLARDPAWSNRRAVVARVEEPEVAEPASARPIPRRGAFRVVGFIVPPAPVPSFTLPVFRPHPWRERRIAVEEA